MTVTEKPMIRKYAIILAVANLITFAVYHTALYVFRTQATLYVYFYFSELMNTILPVVSAVGLLAAYASCGANKPLLYCLYFSLTSLLNYFPYYAYEYAYQGYEIGTVLTFASLEGVFMTAAVYARTLALYLLMLFALTRFSKHKVLTKDAIFKKTDILDFQHPVTFSLFTASIASFIYNLVLEIIDTVSYIREVEGSFEVGEIIYIMMRYVFILALMFISHAVAVFVKNKLTVGHSKEDEE